MPASCRPHGKKRKGAANGRKTFSKSFAFENVWSVPPTFAVIDRSSEASSSPPSSSAPIIPIHGRTLCAGE